MKKTIDDGFRFGGVKGVVKATIGDRSFTNEIVESRLIFVLVGNVGKLISNYRKHFYNLEFYIVTEI